MADAAHQQVDVLYQRWIERGTLDPARSQELEQLLGRPGRVYEHHIRVEEQELLPLAHAVLPPAAVLRVGIEMAQRRGIVYRADGLRQGRLT